MLSFYFLVATALAQNFGEFHPGTQLVTYTHSLETAFNLGTTAPTTASTPIEAKTPQLSSTANEFTTNPSLTKTQPSSTSSTRAYKTGFTSTKSTSSSSTITLSSSTGASTSTEQSFIAKTGALGIVPTSSGSPPGCGTSIRHFTEVLTATRPRPVVVTTCVTLTAKVHLNSTIRGGAIETTSSAATPVSSIPSAAITSVSTTAGSCSDPAKFSAHSFDNVVWHSESGTGIYAYPSTSNGKIVLHMHAQVPSETSTRSSPTSTPATSTATGAVGTPVDVHLHPLSTTGPNTSAPLFGNTTSRDCTQMNANDLNTSICVTNNGRSIKPATLRAMWLLPLIIFI